jgi:HEAT repeat protein
LLDDLHRSEDEDRELAGIVSRLDDDDFRVRQEATIALIQLPVLPRVRLRQIADGANAEVRARIGQALRVNTAEKTERLFALAAQAVAERKLESAAGKLILALSSVESSHRTVWVYGRRALLSSARPDDADSMRKLLGAESALGRACAVSGLSEIVGEKAVPDLIPLLSDPDEQVRMEAAIAVMELGGRECLPVLIDLLEGEHPRTRFRSVIALRTLTGQEFGFRANDLPEKRAQAAGSWRSWYEQHAATAPLNFQREQKDASL